MSTNGDRSGVLGMMRSLIAAPFEERMAREAAAKNARMRAEASIAAVQEIVRRVQPEDDGFVPTWSEDSRELDEANATTLRQQALKAYLRSPHMRGYLRSLLRFSMGEGPTVAMESDDERLNERIEEEVFRPFRRANKWDVLEDEIAMRTWRDGEAFIRGFEHAAEGPPVGWEPAPGVTRYLSRKMPDFNPLDLEPEPIPGGTLLLRLVPPDQIADPGDKVSHGILTSGSDVQTVLGYMWTAGGDSIREIIPAREMMHTKIGVDSDVLRGRSLLEILLKRNKQFEDWLEYRIMLNLARTALVLIKRIEGASGAQVSAIRDAQATERRNPANDRKVKAMKPMSTVHATGGISYEYLSPKLQATDARHDGRHILLSEAAATGMPEYIFTGDASNSNFASTMVAESPAVREFESWQDFFSPVFAGLYRWAIATKVKHAGLEGLSEDAVKDLRIKVTFPPMVARDALDDTKRREVLHRNSVLSRQGWAEEEGVDYDLEQGRVEAERQEDVEFTAPAFGGGDGGDGG